MIHLPGHVLFVIYKQEPHRCHLRQRHCGRSSALSLIAVIVFVIAAIIAFTDKTVRATLVCAGLTLLSAAAIFLA